MDFCFSKPFRHRKQLPSLCTPWISASVSSLGTGSSFPAIILHKSKHLRRIYLIKSTDVPKRPEITAYLRGTNLMKSIAVPNILKPLHTCGEQISNHPLPFLSSRLTVLIYSTYIQYLYTALIYSEQIQEQFKNSSRIAIEIPRLTKKDTKLCQTCKYCTCFSSVIPGLFS